MFLTKAMRHWKMLSNVGIIRPMWHLKLVTVTGISAVLGAMNSQIKDEGSRYYNSYNVPKPPPNTSVENIVWVDMEMTGLDPGKDHVLEVACLVTDGNLNVLAEGPDLCINHPPEVLSAMNEWSTKQHEQSGLTSKCQTSGVPLREAEKQLLDFVREWTPFKKCPLGGNTVYMDRIFLMKYMPEFEQHMHYRIIDVSSVKEICSNRRNPGMVSEELQWLQSFLSVACARYPSRWYPEIYAQQPNKKEISKHRALADIRMSIDELKFYRERIFRKTESSEAVNDQLQWC